MGAIAEMAAARGKLTEPTAAELIEGARWSAGHPDASPEYRRTVRALLVEIDAGKRRLAVAIRYAARLRGIT